MRGQYKVASQVLKTLLVNQLNKQRKCFESWPDIQISRMSYKEVQRGNDWRNSSIHPSARPNRLEIWVMSGDVEPS